MSGHRKLSNSENATTLDKVENILNDPDYVSSYDDLAFEMYVDNDVAKIIREMEYKKHTAVISKTFVFIRNRFVLKFFFLYFLFFFCLFKTNVSNTQEN